MCNPLGFDEGDVAQAQVLSHNVEPAGPRDAARSGPTSTPLDRPRSPAWPLSDGKEVGVISDHTSGPVALLRAGMMGAAASEVQHPPWSTDVAFSSP